MKMGRKMILSLLFVIGSYFVISESRMLETRPSNDTGTTEQDSVKTKRYHQDTRQPRGVNIIVTTSDKGTELEPAKSHHYRVKVHAPVKSGTKEINSVTQNVPLEQNSTQQLSSRRIVARDLSGSRNDITKTRDSEDYVHTTQVLVRAPIPKFYELGYDNDFETHQERISARRANMDSGKDHEDDDFNLGDYDFDVKHDEFLGSGKPLEPMLLEHPFTSVPVAGTEYKFIIQPPVGAQKPVVREYLTMTYKPDMEAD